jgi:hypothetical protein
VHGRFHHGKKSISSVSRPTLVISLLPGMGASVLLGTYGKESNAQLNPQHNLICCMSTCQLACTHSAPSFTVPQFDLVRARMHGNRALVLVLSRLLLEKNNNFTCFFLHMFVLHLP